MKGTIMVKYTILFLILFFTNAYAVEKQSKEHYVTQALYKGTVKADGLPWKSGQTVELPITKILNPFSGFRLRKISLLAEVASKRLKYFSPTWGFTI